MPNIFKRLLWALFPRLFPIKLRMLQGIHNYRIEFNYDKPRLSTPKKTGNILPFKPKDKK